MKTSPNDVSNSELLQEFRTLSKNVDTRIGTVEVSNQEILAAVSLLGDRVGEIEASNGEILETVQDLAQHMDDEFLKVRTEMKGELQSEIGKVRAVMVTKEELQSEMSKQRMTMVTKGYLDDKFADFHSDLVRHTRKEIEKAMR